MKFIGNKDKVASTIILFIAVVGLFLAASCGSEDDRDCGAPYGSTITFNPATQSWDTGGVLGVDLPLDFEVVVTLPDGTPMSGACLYIAGALAIPNDPSAYQFRATPTWANPQQNVPSGFRVKTDNYGKYQFSLLVSAGTGTFKDEIMATSGSAYGSATLELK